MTITCSKKGDEILEVFKKHRWIGMDDNLGTAHCQEHDTYFDISTEPCWECYNEADELGED